MYCRKCRRIPNNKKGCPGCSTSPTEEQPQSLPAPIDPALARYSKLGGMLIVMLFVLAAGAAAHCCAAASAINSISAGYYALNANTLLLVLFHGLTIGLQVTACILILKRSPLMFKFYMMTAFFCLIFLILLVSLPAGLMAQHCFIVANFFLSFTFVIYLCCSRRADVYFQYYFLVQPPGQRSAEPSAPPAPGGAPPAQPALFALWPDAFSGGDRNQEEADTL
ncbi:MAG: hypothetical protein ACYCX2_02020 [Christensenellales bacterium]